MESDAGAADMTAETKTFRSLDVELEERLELLCDAARRLPELEPELREEERRRVVFFLQDEVLTHMATDERLLYPLVAERLSDPLTTAPLRYDRGVVQWFIDEIAGADLADATDLQRLLYGVYTVVKVHLSREQDLYVGVLESAAWPR